jgi:hypothetical protein
MKMVKSNITEKLGEEGGSGFKCLFFPTLAGVPPREAETRDRICGGKVGLDPNRGIVWMR